MLLPKNSVSFKGLHYSSKYNTWLGVYLGMQTDEYVISTLYVISLSLIKFNKRRLSIGFWIYKLNNL